MQLPLGLGRLDFGDWLYGLLAAFITGGASAVTSGITLNLLDPKDFNIYGSKIYITMGAMFLVNGTMASMAFLRQKPLPEFKEITKTTETTRPLPRQGGTETTTIKEVQTIAVPKATESQPTPPEPGK